MSEQNEKAGRSGNTGVMRGVTGRQIDSVGVLDLRGVSAEELAQVESISSVGVVLVDKGSASAMSHIAIDSVGSVVPIDPDYQVMLEPWIEFSKVTLENMMAGQKMVLVGIVLFKPDCPTALVAEKFTDVMVVGILLATAGVQGALMGRIQMQGMKVTISDEEVPFIHSMGETKISAGYLSHIQDGTHYINIGYTELLEDVSVELLAQKIAAYYNVGATSAPAPLLDLLKARCSANHGHFGEPGEEKAESEEAEEASQVDTPS